MFDDGKITESGTYQELIDNNGAFATLMKKNATSRKKIRVQNFILY